MSFPFLSELYTWQKKPDDMKMCVVFGPQPVMDTKKKDLCGDRRHLLRFSWTTAAKAEGAQWHRADWIPSLGVGWVKEILTSHSQPLPQLRAGSVRSRSDFCSCLNHVFLLPLSAYHANVCLGGTQSLRASPQVSPYIAFLGRVLEESQWLCLPFYLTASFREPVAFC